MSTYSSYPRTISAYSPAATSVSASPFPMTTFVSSNSYQTPYVTSAVTPSVARVMSSSATAPSFPTVISGISTGPSPRYISSAVTPSARVVSPTVTATAPTVTTMAPTITTAAPATSARVISSPLTTMAPAVARVAPVTSTSSATPIKAASPVASAGFKLKLGAEIPNFYCETTHGNMSFHEFVSNGPQFTVLFSHPADFTPVCTTELGRCEVYGPEFEARGAQLIGLSCDPVDSHLAWTTDILHRENLAKSDGMLSFPIIADPNRNIASTLGMIDPEEINSKGIALPARALIVIDQTKKVKLAILYPATTGRSFEEVLRVLDSLILTRDKSLATPADWRPGDRCIVAPSVSTEDALAKFEDLVIEELPSGKQYLRHVKNPVQVGVSSGVGFSTLEITREAVADAVTMAMKDITSPVLAFAGCTCERDIEEVQACFAEFLPGVPLHGITSSGFLMHTSGSIPNGIGCLVLQAPEGSFATALADDVTDAASLLAQQMPQPKAIIMSTVPGQEEACIDVLNQIFGVPVYGGTAADNELKGEWKVFGTNGTTSSGISLVGVGPAVGFGASMLGPYAPTEKTAVITKGDGRRAYEINNMPAADWVYEWLGAAVENEYTNGGLILPQTAQKPIGFRLESGQFQSAHLAALGGPDKFVDFFTPIQEGLEMTVMDSGDGPETGYAQTLNDAFAVAMQSGGLSKPAAGLLIYCGGMAIAVGDNLNSGLTNLGSLGDMPMLGLTCFGEQAFHPEDSMNLQRNLSMGFLLFE